MSGTLRVSVDQDVLMYAFRYALGRRTYAPTDVQAAIRTNFVKMEERALDQIITEITTAVRTGYAGTTMDQEQWTAFGQEVQRHLDARRSRQSRVQREMFVSKDTGLPMITVARLLANGWEWDETGRIFSAPEN